MTLSQTVLLQGVSCEMTTVLLKCSQCSASFSTPIQLRAHVTQIHSPPPCELKPVPALILRDSRYGMETVAAREFEVGDLVLCDAVLMDFGALPVTERTSTLRCLFDAHIPSGAPDEHVTSTACAAVG